MRIKPTRHVGQFQHLMPPTSRARTWNLRINSPGLFGIKETKKREPKHPFWIKSKFKLSC